MTDAKEQVLKICEILYDKKALNIRALNVADKTIIAEWFVVCSGRATTQVRTLCDYEGRDRMTTGEKPPEPTQSGA